MRELRWCPLAGLLVVLTGAPAAFGQATESAEPFKVGTFDIDGVPARRPRPCGTAWSSTSRRRTGVSSPIPPFPVMPMPEDMLELIGRYEYGLKYRLYEIVNHLVGKDLLGNEAPGLRPPGRRAPDPATDHVSGEDPETPPSTSTVTSTNPAPRNSEPRPGASGGRTGASRICSSSRPEARSSAAATRS